MTLPTLSTVLLIWPDLSDDPAAKDPGGDPGYWRFYAALLDGRLRLGQILTQEALCAVLDMSLSPLRETMTLLASEGLIEIRKRIGVQILYPDVAFVRTHFQFRGLIERESLLKLAPIVTDDWLDQMEDAHHRRIAEVTAAASPAVYERSVRLLEQQLHGHFVGAFDNPYISDVHAKLQRKLYLLRLLYPVGANQQSTVRSLEEHLAILTHLRHRDAAGAAEALDRHLGGVFHRTLGI